MDSRILQITAFMKENLTLKMTEKQLADRLALTAQHFCRLFKSEIGETPIHYLNKLRMEKARELLQSQELLHLSIKQVAARVGRPDVSHFVRDFERHFGLSPKRYRLIESQAHRSRS